MALTEVTVCNMALNRIGVSRELDGDVDGTLANCTDTSLEKELCDRWYARARNSVLEAHPWTFARKYVTLVLNDDGTGEIWTDEWANAYTYPSDCLKIRRFVNDVGAGVEGGGYSHGHLGTRYFGSGAFGQWRYVVRVHDSTKVILTDVATGDADIEYTYEATDASMFTESFASCLAWKLGSEIGIALDANPARSTQALQMYLGELKAAAASMLNEELPHRDGDGEFLQARDDL